MINRKIYWLRITKRFQALLWRKSWDCAIWDNEDYVSGGNPGDVLFWKGNSKDIQRKYKGNAKGIPRKSKGNPRAIQRKPNGNIKEMQRKYKGAAKEMLRKH